MKEDVKGEIVIKASVDTSELEVALEKAKQLVELLKEAQRTADSLSQRIH